MSEHDCPEMKPCPFCGGTNLASPPGMAVIVCGDCDCAGPLGIEHPTSDGLTHLKGIQLWNERADKASRQQPPQERTDHGEQMD